MVAKKKMKLCMIETWFISDTHFGHKNILEYEKDARPFETLEEMHEVMIERWNSVVKPKDTIYHLGDFCFGKHNVSIASRLNGQKRLILGNHDSYDISLYREHFDKIYGCKFWNQCILSHMPVHPNGLGKRWKLNVHGHLHSRNVRRTFHIDPTGCHLDEYDPNYFNVSCEQNNLIPFHSDILMERIKQLNY
jgi:calcineurin-like phosphoesterase family protein